MSAKTVYATIQNNAGHDVRISGTLDEERGQVLVTTRTATLGWYNLGRFEGSRLTARTLRDLFNLKTEEKMT